MIVRYALLVDGSSDAVLEHIVRWLIRDRRPTLGLEPPTVIVRGGQPLADAIDDVIARTGRSLVVAHRDAESEPWAVRIAEFPSRRGLVRVVPVRMTEAWLLGDETAIRLAAGTLEALTP